jgi:LysM repeat protein
MSSTPQPAASGGVAPEEHVVRAGETLLVIAKQHGITLKALLAANPQLKDPNLIRVGQSINLPPGQVVVPESLPSPEPPATSPGTTPPAVTSVSSDEDAQAFAAMDKRGKAKNLHPIFTERLTMLAGILARNGMKALITDGRRTLAEQDKLFQIGRRGIAGERKVTNARGGLSNHNYGLAVDMYPVLPDSTGKERVFTDIPKGASVEFAHAFNRVQRAIGEQSEGLGLFWGARFSGIGDTPHVQLLAEDNLNARECLRIFKDNGEDLDAVWKEAARRVKPLTT